MTAIGLAHYGGTRGLYDQPTDEWVRALAYFEHVDDLNAAEQRRQRRAADLAHARRRAAHGR